MMPKSLLVLLSGLPLLAGACAVEPIAADCEGAAERIAACYGDEAAAEFAASCDADIASEVLDDACPDAAGGKTDLFGTDILSPPIEQFKYGSIGADKRGVPVAILRAVPVVCADTLPPGADPYDEPLSAFGLIYEPGNDLPIGFSRRRLPLLGIELAGNTCSVCHTSTVRETPASEREIYFGAPATRFDLEAYNEFLLDCITDADRFNFWNVYDALWELGYGYLTRKLSLATWFLRYYVRDLQDNVDSVVRDGPWGPGRDDAIGLSAAFLLGHDLLPDEPAPVDFPSVWNQRARQGHALHWDGAAGTAFERNVLVSVGAGTPPDGVPFESMAAIQQWLVDLPPPRYPYAIDDALAEQGRALFETHCYDCHGDAGTRLWSVVPVDEIGTDDNRVDVVTQEGIDATNALSGRGWSFSEFEKTDGYLSSLLDGIWLRAPYLHNGSVPTLRALLSPPDERPSTFYRGNDVYDQVDVGFVWTLPSEGDARYMLFDTGRQGNGNGGHLYGTDLPEADRDALLEYLKTL